MLDLIALEDIDVRRTFISQAGQVCQKTDTQDYACFIGSDGGFIYTRVTVGDTSNPVAVEVLPLGSAVELIRKGSPKVGLR